MTVVWGGNDGSGRARRASVARKHDHTDGLGTTHTEMGWRVRRLMGIVDKGQTEKRWA
jgi:hypothetical protein